MIARSRGDYDRAEEYCSESLQIRQELGDRSDIASSLDDLGYITQDRGDYNKAEEYHSQSLQIRQELGDRAGTADSLSDLSDIARGRGDYDKAKEYYIQSLRIRQELGDRSGIAISLAEFALLYLERGDIDTAVRLITVVRDTFARFSSGYREKFQELLVSLRGQFEDERFEALVKEAQADPEKVIREALGAVGN
jgi:tetratricopeptide (TPR) repeat protein